MYIFFLCHISYLPFDDTAWGDVTERDLAEGNTAEEFAPEILSLGLDFFGLTLITSEVQGRFGNNELSFTPTII